MSSNNFNKSGFRKLLSLLTIILFLHVNNSAADGIDTLFKSDDIIKLQLRSDFTAIRNDRAENPTYRDGELIYSTPGSEDKKLSVKIRARGIFRRDPGHCNFPPLAINFTKEEVKNTLFTNQDKLKLVTPCQDDEYVLTEYLIYKMYNLVSDQSMKVRLAKIQYIDSGNGKVIFEKYSFFIEDKDHVAERNSAFVKDKFVTPFDLESESTKKISVFQYIIGNKDWYFTTRHNLVLMQPNDTLQLPFAVPYDFDFSGMINADYTKPEGVPDEFLAKRRMYKGIRYTPEEFEEVFDFYRKLRPEFESLIQNMELISKPVRKQILAYLKSFYTVTQTKELIKKEFIDVGQTKKDYNIIDKQAIL
jgi:hypothetical protein